MTGREIRVLVADDSPTVRALLVHAFNTAPGMRVVGIATDGHEAVASVRSLQPDVVTMDVNMPRLDGLQATSILMHESPCPIVIVSSNQDGEVSMSFRSLEAGALAFVRTPTGPGHPQHATTIAELVRCVRAMSEVKVVRRRANGVAASKRGPASPAVVVPDRDIEVVAIGASTGGPLAVLALLQALPATFAVPILLVQHITVGFVQGFAAWLSSATGHRVHVAADAEPLMPGNVYVAPDDCHMGVDRQGRIALSQAPPEHGARPAVSFLMRSVREAYGRQVAAVLLSGMGRDGAEELRELRQAGALTFAQDRETALIFGMPGEAVRLNAAGHVLAPPEIGSALAVLRGRNNDTGDR